MIYRSTLVSRRRSVLVVRPGPSVALPSTWHRKSSSTKVMTCHVTTGPLESSSLSYWPESKDALISLQIYVKALGNMFCHFGPWESITMVDVMSMMGQGKITSWDWPGLTIQIGHVRASEEKVTWPLGASNYAWPSDFFSSTLIYVMGFGLYYIIVILLI